MWSVVVVDIHLHISRITNQSSNRLNLPHVLECIVHDTHTTWSPPNMCVFYLNELPYNSAHMGCTRHYLDHILCPNLFNSYLKDVKLKINILSMPWTINYLEKEYALWACNYDIGEWTVPNACPTIHNYVAYGILPTCPHRFHRWSNLGILAIWDSGPQYLLSWWSSPLRHHRHHRFIIRIVLHEMGCIWQKRTCQWNHLSYLFDAH